LWPALDGREARQRLVGADAEAVDGIRLNELAGQGEAARLLQDHESENVPEHGAPLVVIRRKGHRQVIVAVGRRKPNSGSISS
jgi:hypothetical protein